MLYSVGYFDEDERGRPFGEVVEQFADALAEVYFPWPGIRTCRSDLDDGQRGRLLDGLRAAAAKNLRLCLLINANCYGDQALSKQLADRVLLAADEVRSACGRLDCVTTTSPLVAEVLNRHAPEIERRASVNMRLGTWRQMRVLFDWFDSFYLMREYNYDLVHIAALKKRLAEAGKGLHFLANSGCMADCPAQTFHDNLVAHENGIAEAEGIEDFNPYVCWRRYQNPQYFHELLQNTWIRPEDVYRYEGLFDVMKLATRMHARPTKVIGAYVKGSRVENILELTEPSHASLLYPGFLDGDRFPDDWFETRAACHRRCESCDYCARAFQAAYHSF